MMAVGKSTMGKIVAKKLGLEFIDTDNKIEKKWSMKIAEIFKQKGEKFFRSEEQKEVLKYLKKTNCVISLGGGAFMNRTIRNNILEDAVSIWLDNNLNILSKRAKWNKKRPLLNKKNNQEIINKLYAEREKIYKLADHRINCEDLNTKEVAKKIIFFYEEQ